MIEIYSSCSKTSCQTPQRQTICYFIQGWQLANLAALLSDSLDRISGLSKTETKRTQFSTDEQDLDMTIGEFM